MADDITALVDLARRMPKAELHLHLEGTLEPEMMLELAERNKVKTRFASAEEARAAYEFTDLQSFLDIYYESTSVLRTPADFRDLTAAYLKRAAADGVRHVEPFFDPQVHTRRGVAFDDIAEGIVSALREGERDLSISWRLIMCLLRDLPAADGIQALGDALPYRGVITAIGLDSAEVGNPPEKFVGVFDLARSEGFEVVAHAGEEGDADCVRRTLDLLHVARIDHGVAAMSDPGLVRRLVADRVPLTVCPLSNVRLGGFESVAAHPLRDMLEAGIVATVNSDDPAYFGGYVLENYRAAIEQLGLTREHLHTLARNSFEASFLPAGEIEARLTEVDAFFAQT
ncbi:MAG: adenosine deaminase [Coriobacteriia bacterium]|jgi:adenosine deaminase|nr:adenosine deaminase [Coriobacteriia bacterium]